MATRSKIRYFFISLVIIILLVSCKKENYDVIPNVYIDFTMDITGDVLFTSLSAIGNSVIVTSQTNNWGKYAAGYDNNGIIVYRSLLDEFNAYDRTCPYDYAVNGLSVKVNVDFTQAICPQCSTHYALSAYGTPVSGPSRYPLKNYKTSFIEERYVKVWNY
jgi:nitrite reductase/ring-hydroxylating ferredoxin subunit